MYEHTQKKLMKQVGEKAVEYIEDGMIVGLGTGRTTEFAIRKIGELVNEGLEIKGIPTSIRSEKLAKELNIPLTDLDEYQDLDVTIDGADEVDPEFNLIKGMGGALFREKIVAYNSKQEIIVVDESKMVNKLGEKKPVSWLPVEVSRYGWKTCEKRIIEKIDAVENIKLRIDQENGQTYITDNNNYILDCKIKAIANPKEVELEINNIPGVVENGIFSSLTDIVIVGSSNKGIEVLFCVG
jgi:ribose 5-phosphate isomerase A